MIPRVKLILCNLLCLYLCEFIFLIYTQLTIPEDRMEINQLTQPKYTIHGTFKIIVLYNKTK